MFDLVVFEISAVIEIHQINIAVAFGGNPVADFDNIIVFEFNDRFWKRAFLGKSDNEGV